MVRVAGRVAQVVGLAVSLAASANVCAGALDFYYQQHVNKTFGLKRNAGNITTGYFTQQVDPNNPALGTFQQRYYVDNTYATSHDSPVFLYICGESACEARALNGAIREHAQKFHARLVALEHRYYGVSLPRPTLTTDDLKYLSTDYALRDLENFQKDISKTNGWTGKWVAFGGSYPGSLSAYYRLTRPSMVVGSLASSAPVIAKENFFEYDEHVTRVAGAACADKMRAANIEIEHASTDPLKMTAIKKSFGVEALRDDRDFLFFVADIGSAAVQYGYKDKFCNLLETAKDPLTGYAAFARELYRMWGINDPLSLAVQGAESTDPKDYADGLGMRQWYYQSCMEYGYWQTASADPAKSTRSTRIDLGYYADVCKRLFNITTPANTDHINTEFYRPLRTKAASKIFMTNGSTDPWSRLSMTAVNGNVENTQLNYYTIEGAAHCDDLHVSRQGDSESLKSARLQMSALITDWLSAR
jgi:pimeloyl-ACP methyl ester carboxylesterase